MTPVRSLLLALIRASEKASLIARACRREDDLFSLLIEEKTSSSERSTPDFKTLADVLIQEMIKYDLEREGSLSREQVKGEENNEFTNTLGESITVEVQEKEDDTARLLEAVLDGHTKAAKALARLVHTKTLSLEPELIQHLEKEVPEDLQIDTKSIALWVDPIDSTSNYIRGTEGSIPPISSVAPNGLSVVTVLIGVHDVASGAPLLGVINCPFVQRDRDSTEWMGKVFWGFDLGGTRVNNLPSPSLSSNKGAAIVCGNKEGSDLCSALETKYNIVRAQGAGYKILVVALGLVDFYICSKDTTNKWDTCAGQGILASMNGGIVEFTGDKNINNVSVNAQTEGIKKWRNANGIIAYRNKAALVDLQRAIQTILSSKNA